MGKTTRRESRENAFIRLFALSFEQGEIAVERREEDEPEEFPMDDYAKALLANCQEHLSEIDELIVPKLKSWTLERLPKVSLTVLRLAVGEMLYSDEKDVDKIAINEAVELSKQYGDENDYQFINGVLGNISKELKMNQQKNNEEEAGPV